jgi:hypothetical protein
MAKDENLWQPLAWLVIGGAAAAALLIASLRLGSPSTSPWVMIAFRGGIALLVAAGGLLIISFSVSKSYNIVLSGFRDAALRYPEEVQAIKQRKPFFAASAALVGNGILTVAGASFSTSSLITIAVSLALLLGFYVANELLIKDSRVLWSLGLFLWLLLLLLLPTAIVFHNHWTFTDLLAAAGNLDLAAKIFFAIAFAAMVFIPFLAHRTP